MTRKQLETEHALHQLDGDWGLVMERRFLGWFLPPMHIWGHCVGLYNRLWLQIIREELLQLSSFYTCRLWYQPRPLSRGEGYTTGTVAANVARNGTITRQDDHVVITRHSFNYADTRPHTMAMQSSKKGYWRLCSRLSGHLFFSKVRNQDFDCVVFINQKISWQTHLQNDKHANSVNENNPLVSVSISNDLRQCIRCLLMPWLAWEVIKGSVTKIVSVAL